MTHVHPLRRKRRIGLLACLAAAAGWAGAGGAASPIRVIDDRGLEVVLSRPAQRVASLGPHITELLFAAGGSGRVIAAVAYSDHPEAARKLPRVGDGRSLDLERLAALEPDLIIVWWHGNPERQVEAVRRLGIPVFHSEPKNFEGIASSLERFGRLMGTAEAADREAASFRRQMARLEARYAHRPPVGVFYQIWDQPLMTLNDTHIVSASIRLCGGRNVFGELQPLVPTISREAVVARDPEVLLTAAGGATPSAQTRRGGVKALDGWKAFTDLTAVARGNLFAVNGDWLNRATPRIALAVQALCEALETARSRRPAP